MPDVKFAAIGINHSHIYGQVGCLIRAGARFADFHALEDGLAGKLRQKLPEASGLPIRFQLQMASFYKALEGCERLPVMKPDARQSLDLVTAIYHSASRIWMLICPYPLIIQKFESRITAEFSAT